MRRTLIWAVIIATSALLGLTATAASGASAGHKVKPDNDCVTCLIVA